METGTKRAILKRLIGYPAVPLMALATLWLVSMRMPGQSFAGPLPPLTKQERESSDSLRAHVVMLAGTIGERNLLRRAALDSAAQYVEATFTRLGYAVASQRYTAQGASYSNLEVTLRGRTHPEEIVLVGGHYDSFVDSPGADDNASGTAAVLELARLLQNRPAERTIRFVMFANEEPPFFWKDGMGSLQYARAARARGDNIVAMLSMETVGYYSDSVGSQQYPLILGWFYPNRGNFIGVVGNVGSRRLVHQVVRSLRSHTSFPTAGSAAPQQIPGIGWSDHWSFWQVGYDAVMITDTAPFRNRHYHEVSDTPATLDYDRMSRVVHGVARTIDELARKERDPGRQS